MQWPNYVLILILFLLLIGPKNTRTWFGRPALSLPSVFVYMGHIRKRDGFLGLYRGLGPKLVSMGVSSVVSGKG